jgi:hypothetical protein
VIETPDIPFEMSATILIAVLSDLDDLHSG